MHGDANSDIPAIPGRAGRGRFSGVATNQRDAKPTCCVRQPSDVTPGGVLAVARGHAVWLVARCHVT